MPTLTDANASVTYFYSPTAVADPKRVTAVGLVRTLTDAVGEIDPAAIAPNATLALPHAPARWAGPLRGTVERTDAAGTDVVRVTPLVLHDTVALLVEHIRVGDVPAGGGPPVAPAALKTDVEPDAAYYLGKLVAHLAEVPKNTPPADRAAAADAYARRCNPAGETLAADVPHGRLVVAVPDARAQHPPPREVHAVFVFETGAPVDRFVQFELPEVALYHLKVRVVDQNIRATHLPHVRQLDAQLRSLMGRRPASLGLDELLTTNDDLTTQQADLVAAVADIEGDLHTLAIARANFARAAAEYLPDAARKPFAAALVDRWAEPLKEDAETDLVYRKAARDRAGFHFGSLAATAEVHQAGETWRLAKVMAALTSAQVAGIAAAALSDEMLRAWVGDGKFFNWLLVRLAVAVVGTVVLYTAIRLAFLRRPAVRRRATS
ncbi:MAG TPA: hypothetical protein VD866_00910 [Urbifossiella sp.]|nr:hypothetical protein [Urbifossiella sp.]